MDIFYIDTYNLLYHIDEKIIKKLRKHITVSSIDPTKELTFITNYKTRYPPPLPLSSKPSYSIPFQIIY